VQEIGAGVGDLADVLLESLPAIGSTEGAERTLLAMDLVANEAVAKSARTLFRITALMGARFARGAGDPPPLAEDWDALDRNWQGRAKDFLELARYDVRKHV
jgi:hypothetical protein